MKTESKKPKQKARCPKCDSTQVLYTRKNGVSWCRLCGHEWKAK